MAPDASPRHAGRKPEALPWEIRHIGIPVTARPSGTRNEAAFRAPAFRRFYICRTLMTRYGQPRNTLDFRDEARSQLETRFLRKFIFLLLSIDAFGQVRSLIVGRQSCNKLN